MNPSPNRIAVEALLETSPHPMTTPAIARTLGLTNDQVRIVLRSLRASGRLMNDVSNGGTVYSLSVKLPKLIPIKKDASGLGPLSPAKAPQSAKNVKVIFPDGLKVTHCPSPAYQKLQATEWEHARPEGRDHEKTPSRRGESLLPHHRPIAMCVGR